MIYIMSLCEDAWVCEIGYDVNKALSNTLLLLNMLLFIGCELVVMSCWCFVEIKDVWKLWSGGFIWTDSDKLIIILSFI